MRFRPWTSNLGPALHSCRDPVGVLGVCSSGLHVFCGSGEDLEKCPPGDTFGGAAGVWVRGSLQSLFSQSESCVRVLGSKSVSFPEDVGLRQGCALSTILFFSNPVMFMAGYRGGAVVGWRLLFGGLRISSLLFADEVVLMASSACELQHSLVRLSDIYEAACP